jgi:amino acid adenylation domain-containing protein
MQLAGPAFAELQTGGICEWFARARDRDATAIAVRWRARSVTYRDLDAAAVDVERRLEAEGIGPRSVVAILLADRIALTAAFLSLLRSNRVLVALDPALPVDVLAAVVSDVEPDALLSEAALRTKAQALCAIANNRCRIVMTDGPAPAAARAGIAFRGGRPDLPDEAAYICYTSGSTGRPKGVMGRLGPVSEFIRWEVGRLGIGAGWRVSQLTAPGFDPLFRDLFVPLCTGGTSCAPPMPVREMSADALVGWLLEERVNLLHCVPTVALALTTASIPPRQLPDLRHVLVAGEALHGSLLRQWHRRFGGNARFMNLYGPTETTMVKTFHAVTRSDLERSVVPIGRPVDRTEVVLLDETGGIRGSGEVGEILIRTPDIALGYYRNREATEAAFLRAQGAASGAPVAYRTGDLGRELPDGSLEFVGRVDEQVKIHGVRIELQEVKAALERYPRIRQAEVICQDGEDGRKRLAAYVVLADPEPLLLSDLRVFLRATLRPESVPAAVVVLDAFPFTPNGKVDRAALPAPANGDGHLSISSPRSETERLIAAIWSELLGLDSVGVNESFLDLGGHSITAAQIASRVAEATGREISLVTVFERPTIAELAAFLDESGKQAGRRDWVAPTAPADPAPAAAIGGDRDHIVARYRCPTERSVHFGARNCCLVIVVNEQIGRRSFERLAEEVEIWDPSIHAIVIDDAPDAVLSAPARPTLTFGVAAIRHRERFRGSLLCGSPLAKSEEYAALARDNIPVPRWVLMSAAQRPALGSFAPYVVTKPNYGGRGAEVKLRRRDRVRWEPTFTAAAGMSPELIVQEYVHTGPRPTTCRVTTLFGRVLYAARFEGGAPDAVAPAPEQLRTGSARPGISIVAMPADSRVELTYDPEVLRLAESAHRSFPDIPLLGVDIVREAASGRLYVLEVNAIGYNWNFRGSGHRSWDAPLEEQFDGLRKAAWLLAEQTQLVAS